MPEMPCSECGHAIPASADRCPHCARPGLFPNVRAVVEPDEIQALEERFCDARHEALGRGADQVIQEFMAALEGSKAVIARPLGEAQRLASGETQGYATYYQLIDAEVRVPDGDGWDALRRLADEALFPGYKDKMRFAALSLDAVGVMHYGECSMTLRTPLIAHRATLLEENSAVFMKRREVKMAEAAARVRGYRSSWADRAKLCVAKLGSDLGPGTTKDQFPGILLRQGATSEDDSFVEVHLWGPMTIRTFERVAVTPKGKRLAAKPILRALQRALANYDVDFEVRG